MKTSSRNRRTSVAGRSRGVILLVMLGLLAMFTLIAVTFVVASGQFRRGAAAAAKAEQSGDPFESLLHQALMQVARGSNHPQSAIGPHGLLEDMYGNGDAVAGMVYIEGSTQGAPPPTTIYVSGSQMTQRANRSHPYKGMASPAAPMLIEIGAVSFGWDREPGVALVDDDNNKVTDDVSEVPDSGPLVNATDDCFLGSTRAHPAMVGIPPQNWQAAWASKASTLPYIDNVENYYAGRVITFIDGQSAGQSSYIVRSKLLPINPNDANTEFRTLLQIQPFANGSQPSHKDRFVINGRAFNGAGIGYSPYDPFSGSVPQKKSPTLADGRPNPTLRALDMPYRAPFITPPSFNGVPYGSDLLTQQGEAIAHLPNPVDAGYRDYLNRYGPIIDADEDYDAPDEQNMLLSYSVWIPPIDGSSPGRYRTIMPSLHRPDLIKYMTSKYFSPTAKPGQIAVPRWEHVAPHIRRRYILRPDPSDHYDWTQEPNAVAPQNADGWTPGEPYADTNQNGQWDPVTVVNGTPGPAEPYIDLPPTNSTYDIGDRTYYNSGFDAMDGPWDVDNDGDNLPDSIWVDLGAPVTTAPDGRFVKPLFAILVRDLDGRINVNAHGSPQHYDRLPTAWGPYTGNKVAGAGMQTHERVRIGPFTWAAYQFESDVNWQTFDVVRTHTAGDIDAKRDGLSFRDVPFQGLWALPYYMDTPMFVNRTNPDASGLTYPTQDVGTPRPADNAAPVYPYPTTNRGGPRPLMFDPLGARTGIAVDQAKYIRGFEPAVGQGWSVGDINMAPLMHLSVWGLPRLPSSALATTANFTPVNETRWLLEGRASPNGASTPIPGRYGESHLLYPAGAGGRYPGLVGPRAGITDSIVTVNPNLGTPIAHMLNTGSAPFPASNSIPPSRGDDDYPAEAGRYVYVSNDGRYIRGSAMRNSFMPVLLPTSNPAYTYGAVVPFPGHSLYSPSIHGAIIGDFGTPGDPDGDGFVALDAMGQPVFHNMGTANEEFDTPMEINLHRRYFAQTYFGTVTAGNVALTPAGAPYTTDEDAPYTPAEMERLLRANDSGADFLPTRLVGHLRDAGNNGELDNYDLRRAVTTESWDVPCPHVAPTPELSQALSLLNLPVNNPTIGNLLRARFYLSYGVSVPANAAAHSALLATISQRSYKWQNIPADMQTAGSSADEKAQFPALGAPWNAGQRLTLVGRKRRQTRLLSPDLGLGLRMDVNAPFGNGYDDNYAVPNPSTGANPLGPLGNGVVDEPMEWVYANGERAYGNITGGGGMIFDANRDGNFDPRLDEEARQQYAKELYCLMMLLIDQNYVQPLPTSVSPGAQANYAPGGEAAIVMNSTGINQIYPSLNNVPNVGYFKMQRWLVARRMAQWAVNAVDFRDRDAIMTGFEFDADPFYDNDLDAATISNLASHLPVSNGTWDVDGYLIDDPLVTPATSQDRNKVWRGVVWGCEYPDLILTETAAFHDRRTQNLGTAPTGQTNGLTFDTPTNHLTTTNLTRRNAMGSTESDTTWDQRRVPQGTALFELYCTGNANNPALPRELYGNDGSNLFLDLSRTAYTPTNSGSPIHYPIWRLVITESHYAENSSNPITTSNNMRLSAADRIRAYPATCSFDLRDPGMSVLPATSPPTFDNVLPAPTTVTDPTNYVGVERVVIFANPQGTSSLIGNYTVTAAAAKAGLTETALKPIDVFYNVTPTGEPLAGGVQMTPRPLPGDYVVVGPARTGTNGPHITTIGRTEKKMVSMLTAGTITLTNYTQPHSIIDMANWTDNTFARNRLKFLHTSVNGMDEYPIRIASKNPDGSANTDNNYQINVHPLNGLVVPATAYTTSNVLGAIPTFRQIRPPVSIACGFQRNTITGHTTDPRIIGLNISEPVASAAAGANDYYYPLPQQDTTDVWKSGTQWRQRDVYSTVYDRPLDHFHTKGDATGTHPNPNVPPKTPNGSEYEDQTLLDFKTVFLQRLADPTRGWHKDVNPYLTVDWMPIDLTIFNGEPQYIYETTPGSGSWKAVITDKDQFEEPVRPVRAARRPTTIPYNAIRFGSRQKGAPRAPFNGNYSYFDLWSMPDWKDTSPEFDTRPPLTHTVSPYPWITTTQDPNNVGSRVKITYTTATTTLNSAYYRVDVVRWQDPFDHTFGYLNLGYQHMRSWLTDRASLPTQRTEWISNADNPETATPRTGFRISPVREPIRRPFVNARQFTGWFTEADLVDRSLYGANHNQMRYIGMPRRPFNWLTWNNRPFAGSMELMLVPASSPGRLFHEYSMRETLPPSVPDTTASNPLYTSRYAPFTGRRAANHYMPPIKAAKGSVSTGHANPQASMYAGQFEAGYLVTPPFNHLLNFFESSNAAGAQQFGNDPDLNGNISYPFVRPTGHMFVDKSVTGETPPKAVHYEQPTAANHYRLFEFVTVPSRFSGTKQPHYNQTYNQGLTAAASAMGGGFGTPWEHYGWPFTAPYNAIPNYREPGRVNINTIIPLATHAFSRTESSTNQYYFNFHNRHERTRDDGAAIWRSVLNEFFPAVRSLSGASDVADNRTRRDNFDTVAANGLQNAPVGSNYGQTPRQMTMQRQGKTSTYSGKFEARAGVRYVPGTHPLNPRDGLVAQIDGLLGSNDVTVGTYMFNPSEDYASNFYSAFASMFADDPRADPRGPNGVYENWQYWNPAGPIVYSDDRFLHPFWNGGSPANYSRHDELIYDGLPYKVIRPSMFTNPFRSFMSDYSAVSHNFKRFSSAVGIDQTTPGVPKPKTWPDRALLAVDSTLLRRADTTWNPWSTQWLPFPANTSNLNGQTTSGATNSPVGPVFSDTQNNLYSPAMIDPRFDPLFALNYPRPFRHGPRNSSNTQSFDDAYIPGNTAAKPKWWQYSGYTSSLVHYINNIDVYSTTSYSGTQVVENIRVKDTDFRNTDRNPFFRYQMYTKLSNTITTRSNVYAVWVTVGYFECERVAPQQQYPVQSGHPLGAEFQNKHRFPDGFRILRELGSDNGEAQRHRAFAIIDRTIPVGFLRGENLNVDRCFLIKRIVD